MQHPAPERLAELADGIPEAEEAAHLAACEACAREVNSFRALGGLAAHSGAPENQSPLTDWNSLSARLRAEGLIRGQSGAWRTRKRGSLWALRIAAGLLIFLGGALTGRELASPERDGSAPYSNGDELVQFASVDEAMDVLSRAERDYQTAAAYLAAYSSDGDLSSPELIRARLAAFDAMAGVAREAIYDAPYDPVINQAYMSTLAVREATLRQLAVALPEGTQLSRF